MNTKLSLHQIHLSEWAVRFKDQASSGLSVKEWCAENNFSIHTYNYWKHLLKLEYTESILPDIVPIQTSPVKQPASLPILSNSNASLTSNISLDSRDSRELCNSNSILISIGDIRMEVGASISDEQIFRIIKAVRYV